MNVVFYYPYTLVGEQGAANAVRGLGLALARLGADVSFAIDADVPQGIPDPPECRVVRVPHLLRGRLALPRRASTFLSSADVLEVTSCWVAGKLLASHRSRSLGVPYIVNPQGALHPRVLARHSMRKRLWASGLEMPHLRRAFAIHVLYEDEREHLARLGIERPLVVAPNGIDPPSEKVWRGEGRYLLWIGRYDVECKGLDLLVQALALLPDGDRPELRLRGVDHKGGRRALERLSFQLGLERWVSIGGPIYGSEKRELLAGAAGFVYPSRWEAGGISALEAVALGVPTLTTRFPCGALLAEHEAAIAVDASPQALARGLRALLSGSGERLSQQGFELARRLFSWPEIASSWLRQVEELRA